MRRRLSATCRRESWPPKAGPERGVVRAPPNGTGRVQLGRLQKVLRHAERAQEIADLHHLVFGEVPRTS